MIEEVEVSRGMDGESLQPVLIIACKLKLSLERIQDEMAQSGNLSELEKEIGAEILHASESAMRTDTGHN